MTDIWYGNEAGAVTVFLLAAVMVAVLVWYSRRERL